MSQPATNTQFHCFTASHKHTISMFHSQPQTHNFTVSQPATHTQTAEEIIHHYANPSLLMCPMDPHRGTDPDRQCSHLDLSIIYGCWSMTACANAVPWLPTRGYWPMTANAATWITRDWPITATWVTMVLAHHCQCSHLDLHMRAGPSLPMQPPGLQQRYWPVTAYESQCLDSKLNSRILNPVNLVLGKITA